MQRASHRARNPRLTKDQALVEFFALLQDDSFETLDVCLGRILTAVQSARGTAIVTADHGNAEQMWDDELNGPHTAHTSNPVPVVLCGDAFVGRRLRNGTLRDVAPTILGLLGIEKAPEMTGDSLVEP